MYVKNLQIKNVYLVELCNLIKVRGEREGVGREREKP